LPRKQRKTLGGYFILPHLVDNSWLVGCIERVYADRVELLKQSPMVEMSRRRSVRVPSDTSQSRQLFSINISLDF